jgi:hypothetical protein
MSAHRPFTLRHVLLVAVLFGMALLFMSNTAVPVNFRFPGLVLLAALAIYLAAFDRIHPRHHHG